LYQKIATQAVADLRNGQKIHPVATLADGAARVHIWIDDSCYLVGVQRTEAMTNECPARTFVEPVRHIFPEAFEVLSGLPKLRRPTFLSPNINAAIDCLRRAAETCEVNAPIQAAEGRGADAAMSRACATSYRETIQFLLRMAVPTGQLTITVPPGGISGG
jgi:hypothetical protein